MNTTINPNKKKRIITSKKQVFLTLIQKTVFNEISREQESRLPKLILDDVKKPICPLQNFFDYFLLWSIDPDI
jgi:hypothetical protein